MKKKKLILLTLLSFIAIVSITPGCGTSTTGNFTLKGSSTR